MGTPEYALKTSTDRDLAAFASAYAEALARDDLADDLRAEFQAKAEVVTAEIKARGEGRCPDCGFKKRTGRHAAACPRGEWGRR